VQKQDENPKEVNKEFLSFQSSIKLTIYRPKHPIYERLNPSPPLFANPLLFLLSIFISSNAFRDYRTVDDILSARAPKGKYRILEWAHGVLDIPVFPEMSENGPTDKTKNVASWGR
jgi:hypothetical protein